MQEWTGLGLGCHTKYYADSVGSSASKNIHLNSYLLKLSQSLYSGGSGHEIWQQLNDSCVIAIGKSYSCRAFPKGEEVLEPTKVWQTIWRHDTETARYYLPNNVCHSKLVPTVFPMGNNFFTWTQHSNAQTHIDNKKGSCWLPLCVPMSKQIRLGIELGEFGLYSDAVALYPSPSRVIVISFPTEHALSPFFRQGFE